MPERPGRGLPDSLASLASLAGLTVAWLAGLPRRAGRHLFAVNDAEARWQGWQVTETCGGLGRRYRNPRFGAPSLGSGCQRDGTR